jgi:NADH-quinone oxidoreductase subunit G
MEIKKVNITIDGKKSEALADRNLLHALLALGFDIPHFCYHPALGSVGACRLCAIKKYRDENDNKGRIVMSCMEPVVEGLLISVDDEEVRNFRKAVIESLMLNHPHDCPVCDEGGECHLQDMTVMTGHDYRRYNFRKRTFKNQYLGPFVNHEMNRCIQCYRCVRYYKDYAGGKDLNVFGCHDRLFFGRAEDGVLESEFSGNLAEVCPTGVFTDKTLGNHYTRKWDLTNAPSVCVHCSVGCNIIVSQRYGSVRTIRNRYNGSVNGNFICDRGRFGYEFINSDNRLKHILIRSSRHTGMEVATDDALHSQLETFLSDKNKVIGIGSPRASLESNFTLMQLVGKANYFSGISRKDKNVIDRAIEIVSGADIPTPSLKEMGKADAVLILGENVTDTAPMIALALRQAVRNKSFDLAREKGIALWQDDAVRINADRVLSPLFIISPIADKLDDIALKSIRCAPQDIARAGFAIASYIDGNAGAVTDLNDEEQELYENIAGVIKQARNPLIITGTHLRDESILYAAVQVAQSLIGTGQKANLSFIFPECNSVGSELIGGKPLEEALERIKNKQADTAIILENNLFIRMDEQELESFFDQCKQIIALDHLSTETTSMADIIIPVGTFAETTGTLVNNEGRAQRFYSDIPEKHPVLDSWRWLKHFTQIVNGEKEDEIKYEDIVSSMCDSMYVFKNLKNLTDKQSMMMLNEKIARQTPRFSGRTAMTANVSVHEPPPPGDPDSPLVFSMEGRRELPPSTLVPYYWSPGWNSVQAFYKYTDEPNGSLKGGDPGIRLLDDNQRNDFKIPDVPQRFNASSDNLYLIPYNRIFGSEELSSRSKAIKQNIIETTIYINPSDAKRLSINSDDSVDLVLTQYRFSLKAKIEEQIPDGVGGIFRRYPDIPFLDIPAWGRIQKKTEIR